MFSLLAVHIKYHNHINYKRLEVSRNSTGVFAFAKFFIAMDHGVQDDPEELLEKCWFFGNSLDRKSRMLRTLSDPSSNHSKEKLPAKSYEETYESIKKRPFCMKSDQGHNITTKRTDPAGGEKFNISKTISSKHLLRAPSLPSSLKAQEEFDQDEEIEFSMGKLIRQASLNHSDTTSPRTRAGAAKATSILSRHQLTKKPEVDSLKLDSPEKTRSQSRINPLMRQMSLKLDSPEKIRSHRGITPLTTQKSLSYLESKQLQSFKDVVFDTDTKDSNLGTISMIPGLQERKRMEEDEDKNARSPSLEPDWGGDRSTEVMNMKEQLKFWARAVASNVR